MCEGDSKRFMIIVYGAVALKTKVLKSREKPIKYKFAPTYIVDLGLMDQRLRVYLSFFSDSI